MNPQLVQLFRDALDLAPSERGAYLDAQCSDAALRAQLDALLLAAEETQTPLPIFELPALARRKVEQDRSGEQLGAFRLLKPIGSGGMGAVWLAERIDGFSQQVAIKWLHAGLSHSARSRFAREREMLAKLEHPGIARIVDGGSDAQSDWFAMEYVDGVALDTYVKNSQASLSQRIGLIIALCDAVQYAHQNLIVHRDLKPGNILVNASGQPKLLDFGVAKFLGDANFTESRAPMTFAYAAPEQIRGDVITTATDVYALGVILFELLTGERPHKAIDRAGGDGALSLLQAITDTDATAPSHVVSLRTNTETSIKPKQLRGDLDTIVLKALSRDPARRYAFAQALAEDLAAFLRQMPIRARPETWRYRATKFVRRHVLGVSLGCVALAIVLGLSFVSVIQARHAQHQKRLAEAQAQRATAVQDFLIGLFEQQRPDATLGASVSAKDLLDRAESKLAQGDALSIETRAALLKTLSKLRADLGDYPAALILGNQAVKLAGTSFGADSVPYALALVERSFSLSDSGEPDAAIADCHRALPVLRAAPGIAAELFDALRDCAALERDADALDVATGLLHEAGVVLARLPPDRLRRYSWLNARGTLALARDDVGASIKFYNQYISLLRADPLAAPSDLSSALHSRATAKKYGAQTGSAIADYRAALAIQQRIYGPSHLLTIQSLGSLANQLFEVGDIDESARMGAQAITLARSTLAPDNPALGIIFNDAAISAFQRRDIAGAAVLMQEAIDVNIRAFGHAHSDTLLLMCNLSSLQRMIGRYDAARATANAVLTRLAGTNAALAAGEIKSAVEPPFSKPQLFKPWREAHFKLALIADRVGDSTTQLSHADRIIAALSTGAGATAGAKELPQALSQQAQALIRLGRTPAAMQSAAQLEAMVRARFEAGTSQRAGFLSIVAWVAMEAGDAARALALSQEVLGNESRLGVTIEPTQSRVDETIEAVVSDLSRPAPARTAARWNNFDSLIAAMVHWRALTALHQDAAAKPWAQALRERHKTALPEEALYWQAIASVLSK